MIRTILLAGALISGLGLGGCQTAQQQNAGNGALLGGATGALIGGLATGRAGGALAGAAVGAGTGALVGAAATPAGYDRGPPPARCAERGYDADGTPVCLRYYGY